MVKPSDVPRPVNDESRQQPVVLLGDALRPAEDTFRPLRRLVSGQVRMAVKDLEALKRPPGPDYSLDTEIDALIATAAEEGWQRFHVVGFGEGASVGIVAALRHPERVLSVGTTEPVWCGNREPTGEETALWEQVTTTLRLEDSPLAEAYAALQIRKQARPHPDELDLQPPPAVAPPRVSPSFADARGPALRALWRAFNTTELDYSALVRMRTEVYIAVGSDSHPAYEALARRLHGLVPHIHIEVYEGRSHLDPPHEIEEERYALALAQCWRKSMREAVAAGAKPAKGGGPHFG